MAQTIVAEETDILSLALRTAKEAAFDAGNFLKDKRGKVEVVGKKALHDDLLDADLEAEKIIISKLRKNFPQYDILSEEAGCPYGHSPNRWIVDPLDGSYNFQHGNPTFAISISLVLNDITVVGVVYLPLQEELFTAIRGQGAQLNDQPIHVSPTSQLGDSIIHVGDFAKDGNVSDNKERLQDIAQLANAVGRVRMIGTAATDLAFVACGRAEALVVHNALPWDVEVGCLLVTEAGGKVYRFREDKSERYLMICNNEYIYEQLQDVISKPFSHQR